MAEDLIRYDILAQDALRGVVRKVLAETARTGLPGEHHFFVEFATRAPGVRISSRLLEKYPETMTVVIQHQYWDLTVTEHAFEVGLAFNGVPERLLVPFSAVRGFLDPSVQFGLQFEAVDRSGEEQPAPALESEETDLEATVLPLAAEPADEIAPEERDGAEQAGEDADKSAAEVVRLDAFRKKN